MGWAADDRSRIAMALEFSLFNRSAMLPIDQAMALAIANPEPFASQAINAIHDLLDQYDVAQSSVTTAGADDGVIKLDVIEFSDRPGAKSESALRLRGEIKQRLAAALGIRLSTGATGSSCGGRVRS
jgi:hypothetical protein